MKPRDEYNYWLIHNAFYQDEGKRHLDNALSEGRITFREAGDAFVEVLFDVMGDVRDPDMLAELAEGRRNEQA